MNKKTVSKHEMESIHPQIPGTYDQLVQGRISRREFMRTATLLGMSAGVATIAAACGSQAAEPTAAPEPTDAPAAAPTDAPAAEPTAVPATEVPAPAMSNKRGGILTIGSPTKAVDHPGRYSWIFDANATRMVYEYLTETDKDNVTHPYLLESFNPNDDLTVWDLPLRQGIMFSNGDELKAEHIKWNIEQWLDPDVGSSILGLWEGFLTAANVEIVDDYTLRLNLDAPLLSVPELLFHYPAQIMHPSFDGDISSGKTPGTGPMTIKEYLVGERIILGARWADDDMGYWQMGDDDMPLTYLEGMEFIDLGEDATAYTAAIQGGQIDTMFGGSINPDVVLALQGNSDINISGAGTANTRVWRMRQDLEPWTDQNLVNAVKKTQDREKILAIAYFDEGIPGHDTHLSPVQPAWSPMDLPAYDPEGAKELLAASGMDSLDFKVSVGTGWPDIVAFAETVQEDAKAANINIELETMPNSAFWDLWSETPVGVTPWTHRPLGTMLLPLAYITDAEGTPVPWNESRFIDQEFMDILKQAQGTFDIEERRVLMGELQRIQQERGAVLISYWMNQWIVAHKSVQGIEAHPTNYNLHREVWIDESA